MNCALVIEKSPRSFSREAVTRLVQEAIEFYINGLRQHGAQQGAATVRQRIATVERSRAGI